MALSRWVVNASPLILLGKVEQIPLLGALAGEIAVPRAVIREVTAKPDGERTVQTLTALESTIVVVDEAPPVNILSWDLGAGETQVISHAVARSADRVVIDDLEARARNHRHPGHRGPCKGQWVGRPSRAGYSETAGNRTLRFRRLGPDAPSGSRRKHGLRSRLLKFTR